MNLVPGSKAFVHIDVLSAISGGPILQYRYMILHSDGSSAEPVNDTYIGIIPIVFMDNALTIQLKIKLDMLRNTGYALNTVFI